MAIDLFLQFIRIIAMYIFTIVMLRIAGKRRIASLSPADLIIIIALGSAVGDVLVYPQDVVPIEIAMLAVGTIVLLQIILGKLTEKNPQIAFIIEGRRTLLIENGKIHEKNLDYEDVSHEDLEEMLAERGLEGISHVKKAYLERSGELSIILSPEGGKLSPRRRTLKRKRL